jgi:hypothetical protein
VEPVSPLWVLPVCVLALGAVVVAVVARRLAAEIAAGRSALADLRAIGDDARSLGRDAEAAWRRGAAFAGVPDRFREARVDARLRRVGR